MIRILALDGHHAILEALSATVSRERDIRLCGATTSVDEALKIVSKEVPGAAILEVNLASHYGLDVASEFLHLLPTLKILFYSLCPEVIYAERALRVGAAGFLMKSEPTSAVLDAIRRVVDGDIVLSEAVKQHILQAQILEVDSEGPQLHATSVLTDRELAVFHFVGRGDDLDSIAEKLRISSRTVDSYRSRIQEKLGLENMAELLQFAFACSETATMSR